MRTQKAIDLALDAAIEAIEKYITTTFKTVYNGVSNALAALFRKYKEKDIAFNVSVSRYNRLNKFLADVRGLISDTYKKLYKKLSGFNSDQYKENYMRSGQLFEYAAQKDMKYKLPTEKEIAATIKHSVEELEQNKILTEQRNATANRMSITIRQGVNRGKSYEDIAQELEKTFDMSANKARRAARTEAHRVQNKARLDSAKKASNYAKLKKMWDGTLDTRTRRAHRKLDGTKIDVNGMFRSSAGGYGPAPGMMLSPADDINCRCSVVFLVNSQTPELRRARKEDNSTEVIPYKNYEDWYKERAS